jgi:hypothetical protein
LRGVSVAEMNEHFGKGRAQVLEKIVSGRACDEEIRSVVGVSIDVFRERGLTDVEFGTSAYRALGRQLAVAEREALLRSFERDRGDYGGKSSIASLETGDDIAPHERQPLLQLLEVYGQELMRTGRGSEALKRWRPCFASLCTFVRHDDAQRLTRKDVLRWRDELLTSLAPKTVRDSHIAALKAVLGWAVDAGRLQTNVAADVKCKSMDLI